MLKIGKRIDFKPKNTIFKKKGLIFIFLLYISNISEYQYKNFKPTKSFVRLGVWDDMSATTSRINEKIIFRQKLPKDFGTHKLVYESIKQTTL